MSELPQFFRLRQQFDPDHIEEIETMVADQLAGLDLASKIKSGETVAISCGSRGIANIHRIIKSVVIHFQSLGAKPFIVPAMGSHGGGTAEGQQGVLASYGVTEEYCGCPIRATMETEIVCQTDEGFPVHFDRHAYQADHVLVCNRVKPHTGFAGQIESGLMKMMLIGLGKHEGAKIYHRAIVNYSFDQIVHSVSSEVLKKCKVIAGLAIVENGYDQTAHIEAILPETIQDREKELLVMAKSRMPSLPFDDIDLLIIDEIGKNISGTGMDTNIVGRKFNDHSATGDETPRTKRIFIRGLTEETHGNATGIGLSEFCTTRLAEAINRKITAINCITGSHPTGAMIPISFDTDREVIEAALSTIGLTQSVDAKIIWIHNTLHIAEIACSAVYRDAAKQIEGVEILDELHDLPIGADGNLPQFEHLAAK